MVAVAWLIERLVLGKLVNQEGITLLMATLGITYFLDGFGQTLFGSDIYKIDVGLPKDPIFLLESSLPGRRAGQQGRPLRRGDRRGAGVVLAAVLPVDSHRPRAARGGRRPPGRAVDRHSAEPHLGHRLERGRLRRAGGRHHLGQQARRAVLAVAGGAEGAAGGDPRRPDLGARRHHRRPDHRRRREAVRGLHRPDGRRRHRDLVRATCWRCSFCSSGRKGCSARRSSTASRATRNNMLYRENGQFKTSYRPTSRSFRSRRTAADHRAAGVRLRRGAAAGQRVPVPRDPDSVPDPVAGGARAEHPGRLLRADLAGHRRLHGGGRLCGLQPAWSASTACRCWRPAVRRRVRHRGGRAVRHSDRCASRACTSRWPPWRHSSSSTGRSCASSGSPTTRPRARSTWPSSTCSACRSTRRPQKYLFCLGIVAVFALLAKNLVRSHIGREWMAIRDMDVAAAVIGIRPVYAKLTRVRRQLVLRRRGRRAVGVRLPRLVGAGGVHHRPLVPAAVHDDHRRAGFDHGQLLRRRLHRDRADRARPARRYSVSASRSAPPRRRT